MEKGGIMKCKIFATSADAEAFQNIENEINLFLNALSDHQIFKVLQSEGDEGLTITIFYTYEERPF